MHNVSIEEYSKQLRFLGFSEEDRTNLLRIDAALRPHLPAIIDRFYEVILAEPILGVLLEEPGLIDRLKVLQTEYLIDLFTAERNAEYLLARHNIGVAHYRAGLDTRWYTASYAHLERLLVEFLERHGEPDPAAREAQIRSLHKAIQMDIGLCVDAYVRTLSRRLMEEAGKAIAASRLKSEFLAKMSHELRTPLSAIINFTDYVKTKGESRLTARLVDRLERVLSNADYLLGLINDILDLSKIEAGKLEIHLEPVALSTIHDQVHAVAEPLFKTNNNRFIAEFPERDAQVHIDPLRLRQIVINLLSNAAKFTSNGTVCCRLFLEDGWLRLQVQDTGIGIPKIMQRAIFDEFYQLQNPKLRNVRGTGLGLAICKRLSEMMGGRIEVESEPGVGSTFSVHLPAEGPSRVQAALRSRNIPPIHTWAARDEIPALPEPGWRRVLVVDDDVDVILNMHDALEGERYQVIGCVSPFDGMEFARYLRPDVILLDVLMPHLDGWEFIHTIKKDPELAGIPIVFLSVFENRIMGINLGAAHYLVKPVKAEELRRVLARVIGPGQSPPAA